jgi:hypothetical protein
MVASGVSRKAPEPPSSPVCYADEATDAYMGFASREDIAAALGAIDAAEQAGRFGYAAQLLGELLPKVRDDALHLAYRERLARLNARAEGA